MVIEIHSHSSQELENAGSLIENSRSAIEQLFLNQPSLWSTCCGIYILIDQILTTEEESPVSEIGKKQLRIAQNLLNTMETCKIKVIPPSSIDKKLFITKIIHIAEEIHLLHNSLSDELLEKARSLCRYVSTLTEQNTFENIGEQFLDSWKAFTKIYLQDRLKKMSSKL